MNRKPVVHPIESKKPVLQSPPPKDEWLFSFKDFKQIENFGLSTVDSGWFSSLLSRLSDLSKISVDVLAKDRKLRDDMRYHPIDWGSYNIPIQRNDFDWVSKEIIRNEEEFPFFQFHVSKALGRVIGYWEGKVFNILLFDPMHNMQPSKRNVYKIRASSPVETDISSILSSIDEIKRMECTTPDCKIKKHVLSLGFTNRETNAVVLFLEDDYYEYLDGILEKHSLSEIVETGIIGLI